MAHKYKNRLAIAVDFLLKPHWVVLASATSSFLAWVLPWPEHWRVGYQEKEVINYSAILLIVSWYMSIAWWSYIGYALGRRTRKFYSLEYANGYRFYLFVTLAALIGTSWSYLVIIKALGIREFVNAILQLNANELRYALPYEAGLQSLRYSAIVAGAYAVVRCLLWGRCRLIDFMNVGNLLMVAMLASRLSLLMATIIALGLSVAPGSARKLKLKQIAILLATIAFALVYLNWLRNAPFYQAHGTSDPISAATQEAITYLGSPFQVQVGILNEAVYPPFPDTSLLLEGLLWSSVPTFLHSALDISLEEHFNLYRTFVSIEPSLTTNSAFASLYALLGVFAWPYMWIVSWLSGLLVGHFSRYSSPVRVVAYALLYAFAELWRVYLFNQGILYFVIVISVTAALASKIRVLGSNPRRVRI